jgi:hypothetical protein
MAARLIALAVIALVSSAAFAQPAAAQQPILTLKCTSGNTTVPVGGSVAVACTLLDSFGAAGRNSNGVTFTINYENGTNAAYEGGSKSRIVPTDSMGRAAAVVNAGTRPGTFGILVTYYGVYSQAFAVLVEGPPTPAAAPAAPPVLGPMADLPQTSLPPSFEPAPPPGIRPPSTGDGGLAVR